jgi:muconolactone D-isomerase
MRLLPDRTVTDRVEFLVVIEVRLPPDLPEERRQELLDSEAERGGQLIASGALKRIWRLPGQHANISLYSCEDATELHQLLSSLPLFPWFHVDVHPLAVHPLEVETDSRPETHAS